jgi:hypothetical protein
MEERNMLYWVKEKFLSITNEISSMDKDLNESELSKFTTFSQSLGKILGQIGAYTIIQIIAGIFIAVISFGMMLSAFITVGVNGETSLSEIFNSFQTTLWTILIASIILEVIMYYFLIRLIIVLKDAENQGIPYQDKYHKSALFFAAGIIIGIILFIVGTFLMNYLLQIIHNIFYDPSFDIEDLGQIPSTGVISSLVEIGRIILSAAGFYYLLKNFEMLQHYIQNGEKIVRGFRLVVIGFSLMILGNLLGLVVDLASLLGFIGFIITIIGYFQAASGLKKAIWTI